MKRAKLKKTVAGVGYAPAQIDEVTGEITYGTPIWFPTIEAGGREYAATPNGETTSIHADGQEVYSAEENHGYDIDLTLLRVCDDVDEAWLGRVIEESGVVEYATNEENPHFALFIIEDTTDGVGETKIWYNCHCTERPEENGKTTEGAGFDPEFPTYKIAARPRMSDSAVSMRISGKKKFTEIPQPMGCTLKTLEIGSLALTPAFRGSVYEYTAATSNSTDIVNAVPAASTATVEITNGATKVENGTAAVWSDGSSILTITVTNGENSQTYKVTVTKS